MRGLTRGVAALLPAFVTSLVLPQDQAQFPIDHVATERPAAGIPFIYEYRIKDDAFIQFTIPQARLNTAVEEPEQDVSNGSPPSWRPVSPPPQLISITVPSSETQGCSEDANTEIQVNEKTLIATRKETVNGRVVQRSGYVESGDPSVRATKWDLQCTCLDDVSLLIGKSTENCQNVGYVLNFHLPTSAAQESEGFTLSFSQYRQAKLHRLTTLALSALQLSAASVEELRNSHHWLSPLLRPIDTIIAKVPTPTISKFLPAFSSTNDAAFRTITTRDVTVTPASSIEDSTSSHHHAPTAVPTPQVAHDELDRVVEILSESDGLTEFLSEESSLLSETLSAAQDAAHLDESTLAKFKQTLQEAGVRLHSSLESIVQKLTRPSSHESKIYFQSDKSRNETRDFHDIQLPDLSLPEVSHTHKALILSLVLLVLASGTAFTCIWYRDPRRRAERAARREERINRRLYKNAACKHMFQKWVNKIRGREVYQPQSQTFERAQIHIRRPSGEADLEWLEKNSETALSSERPGEAGPSSHGVRKGIGELRDAYGFVEGILRATSGMYRGPRSHHRGSSRGSRRQRRSSDSASEKSMLPPYTEKEEYDEVLVVDGLHFTLRRRDTPGSSIIATSPHESDCGSTDSEKE